MAAYSGCGERDGGLRHGEKRSRTGMARVGGEVQLAGGRVSGRQAPSGRKWQGSQSSEGATELGFPAQVQVMVNQFTQTYVLGQRDRKEQPSIGHQAGGRRR